MCGGMVWLLRGALSQVKTAVQARQHNAYQQKQLLDEPGAGGYVEIQVHCGEDPKQDSRCGVRFTTHKGHLLYPRAGP